MKKFIKNALFMTLVAASLAVTPTNPWFSRKTALFAAGGVALWAAYGYWQPFLSKKERLLRLIKQLEGLYKKYPVLTGSLYLFSIPTLICSIPLGLYTEIKIGRILKGFGKTRKDLKEKDLIEELRQWVEATYPTASTISSALPGAPA
jgi:drug/metabolite transporter (DMT)-like permease